MMNNYQFSIFISVSITILNLLCETIPQDNPNRDAIVKYAQEMKEQLVKVASLCEF